MAWFDAILGPLNVLDWAEGLLRGIYYGDVTPARVALPHPDCDWWEKHPDVEYWNLTRVRELLRDYNVKTYWHGFNEEHIWTHVPQRQARWAEYILHRAGAIPPVQMQTIDGRNVAWASNPAHGGRMPTRWDDRPAQDRRAAGRARRRSARQGGEGAA